jgi:two-component system C4-dicarboxylate transport sensor histidine kinase DctB
LEQVLINLIGNAIDAMRETTDKALLISATPCQLGDQPALALHVQDSGKGLSDTDLVHLFQPFYTTKASGSGLGLGLVICRDIAAEFGGELQARNVPGGGACFTLTVPLWHPAMHPDTPSPT